MSPYAIPLADHHLPAGEPDLPALNTTEAQQIAAHWTCTWRPALSAFAVTDHPQRANLAAAVADVRADLAEVRGTDAYALRLLLVHLQKLCEQQELPHTDDDSYWCWCQPYLTPTRTQIRA